MHETTESNFHFLLQTDNRVSRSPGMDVRKRKHVVNRICGLTGLPSISAWTQPPSDGPVTQPLFLHKGPSWRTDHAVW